MKTLIAILLFAAALGAQQLSTVKYFQQVNCTSAGLSYLPWDGVQQNSNVSPASWVGFEIYYAGPTSPAEIERCVEHLTWLGCGPISGSARRTDPTLSVTVVSDMPHRAYKYSVKRCQGLFLTYFRGRSHEDFDT